MARTSKGDFNGYSKETRLIHGRPNIVEWDYSHHVVPPITASTSFRLGTAERGAEGFQIVGERMSGDSKAPIYVYDRMGEPTVDMLQQQLATAEGGDVAVAFSTGMAAVSGAILSALKPGGHIVSHQTIYGCTYTLMEGWLKRFGFTVTYVDLSNPNNLRKAMRPETGLVYLESPANPSLGLLDIPAITKIIQQENRSRKQKLVSVIDNTFATPYCQRPLEMGVDMVVQSVTKGISGFGVDMGGAVITSRRYWSELINYRKDFGAVLAPEVAWRIMVFGLSTLNLRMPKQQDNAMRVAKFLEEHKAIERVHYPGLKSFPQFKLAQKMMRNVKGEFAPGSMVYFVLKGSPKEALSRGRRLMNFIGKNSYCVTLAVSLGQIRSLIEHPGSMTHAAIPAEHQAAAGIDPGGIRLSLGIESPDDIIADLKVALAKSI